MKEVKREVKSYIIYADCECGGIFKPTNMCLMSYPPQYPHKCNKCGKEEIFSHTYPVHIMEEVDL